MASATVWFIFDLPGTCAAQAIDDLCGPGADDIGGHFPADGCQALGFDRDRVRARGMLLVRAYLDGAISVNLQHHNPLLHTLFGVYSGLFPRPPTVRSLLPFLIQA
jgi:hypothetical protein